MKVEMMEISTIQMDETRIATLNPPLLEMISLMLVVVEEIVKEALQKNEMMAIKMEEMDEVHFELLRMDGIDQEEIHYRKISEMKIEEMVFQRFDIIN